MPSDRLVFKIHHRWRDQTVDFEACSVGEALRALRWDATKCTILSWRCPQCIDGLTDDGYCTCPIGDLLYMQENEGRPEYIPTRRENPALEKLGGLL